MADELIRHRRALHRIPELSFDLPKTSAYVRAALSGLRCNLEPVAECGLLAFFDAGRDRTTAFRTDMDALPIIEKTDVGFISTHPGVMHACGHDGHMAMLLALAAWLDQNIASLTRNVLLIFQPAEENGGGGGVVARSGALDKYHIEYIFALHVDPDLPVGVLASKPGPLMAKSSEVFLTARGKAAHAAKASEGIDALAACARFYLDARQFERSMDGNIPRLLHFGSLHGGSAPNIVCDEAKLHGTMRAFSLETYDAMRRALQRIALKIERETGAKLDLSFDEGYPPLVNDEDAWRAARERLGGMALRELDAPSMLTEDFAFYLQKYKGLMLKLGVGCGIPLHADTFNFDERALETGLEALKRLAL